MAKQQNSKKSCRIYALAQQKGGVGKTTTTINLGAALAELKNKVLLIDLDPQGALSAGCGINALSLKETVYDVMKDQDFPISQIIKPISSGCDLAPANIDLAAAEVQLASEPGRERILKEKLLEVEGLYDYILIDCPPSLGLLTLNALAAAHAVIVPVQTQYFALRGMDMLFDTVKKVKRRINPSLEIAGILPTIYDSRTLHAREVMNELIGKYSELVLETSIPQTVKLADSVMAGQSIIQFMVSSPATEAYRKLAKEVAGLKTREVANG
jgi:chromosome partitioning protein